MPSQTPIWSPSAERVRDSNLLRFIESTNVRSSTSNEIRDYASLHRWSIEHNDAFWQHTWQFCKVVGKLGSQVKSLGEQNGAIQTHQISTEIRFGSTIQPLTTLRIYLYTLSNHQSDN